MYATHQCDKCKYWIPQTSCCIFWTQINSKIFYMPNSSYCTEFSKDNAEDKKKDH